jgi:hypothetical protein
MSINHPLALSTYHLYQRYRFIFLALFFVAIWLIVGWNHLRQGQGFMRLHLAIMPTEPNQLENAEITAISAVGRRVSFIPSDQQVGSWSLKRFTGNIKEIQINGVEKLEPESILVSAGWEDTSPPRIKIPTLIQNTSSTNGNFQPVVSIKRRTPGSLIPKFSDSLNWEGDTWLLITTSLQSLNIALLAHFLITLLCPLFFNTSRQEMVFDSTITKTIVQQLTLATILLFLPILLVQMYSRFELDLNEFRDPIQKSAYYLFQIFFILLLRFCLKQCHSYETATKTWLVSTILLLSLKAVWVYQITTIQCSDYGLYWSYAKLMATSNWEQINTESPLSLILLRRSWGWCYWIARFIGTNDTSLKLANFSLQVVTILLFSWYVKTRISPMAMAASVVVFILNPENWVSVTLASHDLPGLFWFVVLLYAVDFLKQSLESTLTTIKSWLHLLIRIALTGAIVAALNVQRDYGLFALLALALMGIGWLATAIENLREVTRRVSILALTSIAILASSTATEKLVEYEIRSHYTNIGSTSVMAYITSVQSQGRPSSDEMQPWRFLYYPSVPEESRMNLCISKLVHEKLVRLDDYRRQILENVKQLGFSGGLIGFTFGGSEEQFQPNQPIPWMSFLFSTSAWIETLVGLCFLVRILFSWRIKIFSGEIFPILFCLTQTLAIVMLGEVNSNYDSFLVVPFSLAMGALFNYGSTSIPPFHEPKPFLSNTYTTITKSFHFLALPFILISLSIYLCFNLKYNHNKQFISPVNIISRPITSKFLTSDTEGIYILLPSDSNSNDSLKRDALTTVSWDIESTPGIPITFFLAGNQRKQQIASIRQNGNDTQEYTLMIDGRIIKTGKVSELQKPQWISTPIKSNLAHFQLSITDSMPTSGKLNSMGVSVEYFRQEKP